MQKRFTRIYSVAMRPIVAALSIACVLLGTVGFPVVRRKVAEGDAPYPCQNHACGCVSAEACWKGCCCFTHAEKLAWAERNGVTPPAYVLAPAAHSTPSGACCDSRKSHAQGGNSRAEPAAHCSRQGCAEQQPAAGKTSTTTLELAIGELARHCQGLSPWWAALSAALPPTYVEFCISCEPAGWLRVDSREAESCFSLPAVPPPRVPLA